MRALELVATWPVDHVSGRGRSALDGDRARHASATPTAVFRLASLAKTITAWAALVAVEEGMLRSTSRSASRAARCATCSPTPAATRSTAPSRSPARSARRIYSNTGIELAADAVADGGRHAVRRVPARGRARAAGHDVDRRCAARRRTACGARVDRPVPRSSTRLHRADAASAPTTAADGRRTRVPRARRRRPRRRPLRPVPVGPRFRDPRRQVAALDRARPIRAATFGHFGGAGTFIWVDLGPLHGIGLRAR